MDHVNCSITLCDLKKVKYETEFGASVVGSLAFDALAELTIERLNHWVNYAIEEQAKNLSQNILCELHDLQTLGLHLYRVLFSDRTVRQAFLKTHEDFRRRYSEDKNLRLRLKLIFDEKAQMLARLPWEFLYIPKRGEVPPAGQEVEGCFFAGQTGELVLTRWVQATNQFVELSRQDMPLRIVIVMCSPDNEPPLDSQEIKDVALELKGLEDAGRVVITPHHDLTYSQLEKILNPPMNDPVQPPPHVFHFIGHGKDGMVALIMDKDDPAYPEAAFDQKTKQKYDKPAKWITKQDMRTLLSEGIHRVRLVFLQVCKGAAANTAESFKSTASELAHAEIPAVVAMQYAISNYDARQFARTFYQHIADGKEIDEAVNAGRSRLGNQIPSWRHPRFGTPVVYLQTDKALVIPREAPSIEKLQSLILMCKCGEPNAMTKTVCGKCRRPLGSAEEPCTNPPPEKQKTGPCGAGPAEFT